MTKMSYNCWSDEVLGLSVTTLDLLEETKLLACWPNAQRSQPPNYSHSIPPSFPA